LPEEVSGLGNIYRLPDLAQDEESFLQSMPAERRCILSCKRLKLLEKMISDEGYPDKTLPHDISQGFSLVGHAPTSSGVLPAKIEPATLAVSELSTLECLVRRFDGLQLHVGT